MDSNKEDRASLEGRQCLQVDLDSLHCLQWHKQGQWETLIKAIPIDFKQKYPLISKITTLKMMSSFREYKQSRKSHFYNCKT